MTIQVENEAVPRLAHTKFRMLIGGRFIDAENGAVAETINPSTGEVLAEIPQASPADVQKAVEAAKFAQADWQALSVGERSRCFARFDELLEENSDRLAEIDSLDSGNPIGAMRLDVRLARDYVRGWPGLAQSLRGEVIPASPGNLHYTRDVPYGVVGRITAFNHPLMFAATRPLPSLITGNTLVMKPAPQTSLSTLVLAELFDEAFPPGVVNIVSGGADAGDAIVTNKAIKRIAFTGSTTTGLLIQRRAAESGTVKHISLELGGKNAMVIFPDVDIATVVDAAIFGMNFTVCQGQSCGSNSRVLVHRKIYDEFVQRAADALRTLRVGIATDETTDMGPVVSSAQLKRVNDFLQAGVDDKASLVTGGDRPVGTPSGGYFINPAMFADVHAGMRIAREEIFGPIMSVMVWDDYDEMIELANGVDLGLTASVWTNSLSIAHKTAEYLDAGYVWINDSTRHYFGTPFGGMKNSGIGREESIDELRSFMESKVVHTSLSDPKAALHTMLEQGRLLSAAKVASA